VEFYFQQKNKIERKFGEIFKCVQISPVFSSISASKLLSLLKESFIGNIGQKFSFLTVYIIRDKKSEEERRIIFITFCISQKIINISLETNGKEEKHLEHSIEIKQ
jgi:hypothetical protein